MEPSSRLWQDIIERYRAADWMECVRLARKTLDSHPDDLPVRFLLARLHAKLGDQHLAQLQYERLLPLAVGQGDLLRALAAQKQLDLLSPGHERHAKRYAAMHQWFGSLGRGGRAGKRARKRAGNLATALVRLGAERFGHIAENSHIEALDLESRTVDAQGGVLWVVLYGRVRACFDSTTPGETTESVVCADQNLCSAMGRADIAGVRVLPELPTECLALDPALLAELGMLEPGDAGAQSEAAGGPVAALSETPEGTADAIAPEIAPAADPDPPLASAEGADAPAVAEPEPSDAAALMAPEPSPAPPPVVARSAAPPRPVPDPVAEPWIAMVAPIEKRPVTRIAVSLGDRTALLGLAGTRVAPIRGWLHSLSAAMILIGFPREQVLPLRRVLDRSVVEVRLTLDGRVVLNLAARMLRADEQGAAGEGAGRREAQFTLEFLSVGVGDRAKIDSAIAPQRNAGAARAA